MTVSSEVNRAGPYLGNGSTTVFGFGFRILSASHLRVIVTDEDGVEADLPYPSGYSVTGVGANAGGSITISPAPAAGSRITILRNVPMVQETDLENQGAYYAETIERQFDLVVMQNQQQSEELRRAVKVPAGDPDPDGALSSNLALGILRLYESADNIDTVANGADAIDTVAATIVQVQTVASEIAAVQTVSAAIGDIGTVAGDIADVRTVAGVSDEVSIVATNIDTLLGLSGSILSLLPLSLIGDGASASFNLPVNSTTSNVIVWLNKVRQTPVDDYQVADDVLTFSDVPVSGDNIELLIVTAVTTEAIQDLYDDFLGGVTIQKRNVITTAGQRRYAVDAAGAALSLRAATSAVFGASPFGMLTLGVDYTIDDGALLLSFDPADGELLHAVSFPRASNSEAQVILQELEDRVGEDADRAEAAAATAISLTGATPQQFGDGTGGWQAAINAAILQLSSSGSGRLTLPAIPGGYTITSDVVLRNGVELNFMPGAFIKVADGAHNVRPISTVNFDAHAAAAVSRADASRGWKITNGWVDGNRENTTWDEGQFSGIGVALYGIDFEIDGLKIFNTHGTGLCTFYDGGPSPRDGRNGIASDIYVQTAGRHGWHNRLTDFHVDNVNIVMPSRLGNNLWDGALLERSVRMSNVNIWTTIAAAGGIFPRTALNVQTGGCTIKNAHLETGHLLLDVNGQYNQIEAYLYYGVGAAHAQLRNNFNQLHLCMTNTFYDVFEGIRIGTATGQAQYNQVWITGSAFRDAIVNFINSTGFNSINGRCFSSADGGLMIGTPHPFDTVDVAGSYAGQFKQYSKKAGTTAALAAAGTDQTTATLIERDQARVTGSNGTVGVRLGVASDGREVTVYNSGSGVLKVYPAVGQRFSGLAANAPLDIPAFATRRLVIIDSGVWAPLV